ncbi:ATP-binding protein [Roseivirga sp. E12]|uniref:ATP-binding protein n=1 Tax=Roseivirga sp. E12 TaxID=2819237 RepID=UPI001ABD39A1|nr:ATP-binding protein [Roseivirga sp. E12]MBO3697298.1 response regulator [Roseivirga sp. E12]
MKAFLLFAFMMLSTWSMYGQEAAYTFEQLQLKEAQLKQIERWEYWLGVASDQSNTSEQMRILLSLSEQYYSLIGNQAKAYDLSLRLEDLINEQPNAKAIPEVSARLYLLLGKLNGDQEEYSQSLSYFLKAKGSALASQDTSTLILASNYEAQTYSILGREEEAMVLFKKLITNNSLGHSTLSQAFLARHYLRNNQLDSTLYFAHRSIAYKAEPLLMSDRHWLLATSHFYVSKNYDSSLYHGKLALNYALEVMAPRQELNANNVLLKNYEALGNAASTNFHLKRFYALQEAQNRYSDALRIGRINIEKEREEAMLQKELANEKLSGRNRVILITACAVVVLVILLIWILKQLKQIRRQNHQIALEKQRAEISEQYKEQFLANMSHEIRTPMHAISGMLNALLRKVPREDQQVFLNAMKISADNLLVLLNDVLDMSKVEAGQLEIDQDNIRPGDIINQVLELFQSKAQEKNLLLTAELSQDFPECALGDASRLSQVLINLVSNALKFTNQGYVLLKAALSDDKLLISVKDTGIGIPPTESDNVLGAFTQGSNIEKGKHGGTGLGLSICKQIIELQHGKLWFESKEGEGSSFYVELPYLSCESEANASEMPLVYDEAMQRGAALTGLRVLIAEDVEFNVMVVCDDLEWFIPKVQYTVVNTGKEAVEAIESQPFDIVLMDVQMPEMNGYEATRTIRSASHEWAKIPIVAMTASLLKDQVDRCYKAGMDDYIPKPYKPEALIEKIHTLIKR